MMAKNEILSKSEAIQRVDGLIRKRKFRSAARHAEYYMDPKLKYTFDAHDYFVLSLALRLGHKPIWSNLVRKLATTAYGYDVVMEGDFHRDTALSLVRAHRNDEAMAELRIVRQKHAGNRLRMGAYHMALGRIYYDRGAYLKAYREFARAWAIWRTLPDELRDAQWELNNKLHWMRAAARLKTESAPMHAGWLADDVHENDPSSSRRRAAWLINAFPRYGVVLVDLMPV